MIDYLLNGIDENGNMVVDIKISADRAAKLLLELVQSGEAKITVNSPGVGNYDTIAAMTDKIAEQAWDYPGVPAKKKIGRPKGSGKKRGCPECGSPTVHHKGCSYRGTKAKQKGNEEFQALDDRQPTKISNDLFQRVKYADKENIPPPTIAHELGIKVKEVNKALEATDYEHYLSL